MTRADAIASGYQFASGYLVYNNFCNDTDSPCREWYFASTGFCEVDCYGTEKYLFGPGDYDDYVDYYNGALDGKFWIRYDGQEYEGSVISKTNCEDEPWPEGYDEGMIVDTWPDAFYLKDNSRCCNTWVTGGTWPNETLDCCEVPCCIQITGFDFGSEDCGTYSGEAPDWDGLMFMNYNATPASYAPSPSYDYLEPVGCYGNFDSANGKIPGTNLTIYPYNIIWWDSANSVWTLDLVSGTYIWHGLGRF